MSPALSLTVQVGPSRWLLGKPKNLRFRSYPHPTLPLLACFLLCVQCPASVLSQRLQGP